MNKNIIGFVAGLSIFASTLSAASVYATVNGEDITKDDVSLALRNPGISFETLPKATKEKLLNQLIDKKLLSQAAAKSGVESSEAYKKALVKIKQDLALELWMQNNLKNIKVSKEAKLEFYKNNKHKFKSEEKLSASHILVKDEKDAKEIISQLDKAKNKKETFTKLAKTKSTGPSGANGGALGEFSPKQMVPEFSSAAMKLNKGEYTKSPVKTQFGYHVIYLDDKMTANVKKFDEVQKQISQTLLQKEFGEFVKKNAQELRKKAKIVIK